MDKKSKSIISAAIFGVLLIFSSMNIVMYLLQGFKSLFKQNPVLILSSIGGMVCTLVTLSILTISAVKIKRKNVLSIIALTIFIISKVIGPIRYGSMTITALAIIVAAIIGFVILPSSNTPNEELQKSVPLSDNNYDVEQAIQEKLSYYQKQYEDGIISSEEFEQIKKSLN